MGNEFAEKKSRVKPDTSRNRNKQSRSGADLFPSHLPLEQSLYYPGAEARWTGKDRRSHEYSDEKVFLPPYGNRQWTGAIGKEAIAHKSQPSSRQSRMLQKNISPIFSIDANVLQRKGEYLINMGKEIDLWINSPVNYKIAELFHAYERIGSESTDYQLQLGLLEEIKSKSLKYWTVSPEATLFLKLVDNEIAFVKVQSSIMKCKEREEMKSIEKRDREIKQERENKYGKSMTIYDLDDDYSEEYIRYYLKKECPEYINEHYICFGGDKYGDIYYKDKKYTTLKQVEEEFEKAEKLRREMGK